MQLVIEISDGLYNNLGTIKNGSIASKIILNCVRKGQTLPKGHGRLIDADKFLKDNEAYTGWILNSSEWGGENAYKDTLEDLVNEAPTIIEVDKGDGGNDG